MNHGAADEDEAGGLHRWEVAWDVIECRCGEVRPRGVTCDCGFRPPDWEIDQHLQRRRRRLADARRLLNAPSAIEQTPTLTEVMDALRGALDASMGAVSLLVDKDVDHADAAQSIANRLSALYRARDLASACSPQRPLADLTRAVQSSGDGLATAIDTLLKALTQAVPLEAQQLAQQAQSALNDAGERIGAVSARKDELSAAIEASSDGYLSVVARQAAALWQDGWSPPIQLPTFDTEGEQWKQAMTVWLSIGAAMADLAFDAESYWAIAGRTVTELAETEAFSELLLDARWRADYGRHSAALREVDAIVEATLAARLGEGTIVRAELQRYTTHVEGLTKFVLRTRLAVARGEPYARQPTTLHKLLDSCLAQGWYAEVSGIDRQLRNATSHEDVDVDPNSGEVILDPGKATERRLDRAVYLDRLLAAIEVLCALSVGLGLNVLKNDPEFAVDVSMRSVSSEDFAILLLGLLAQPVESAEIVDDVLRVSYDGPIGAGALAALNTAGSMLRAELDAVVAVDGSHVLRAPLLGKPTDTGDTVAAVTAMRMATFDDLPIATTTQTSIVLTKAAIDAMGLAIRESISYLRHLRDVAARLDCPVAAESITALLAAQRQGHPVPLDVQQRILQWQHGCEPMHPVTKPLLTANEAA